MIWYTIEIVDPKNIIIFFVYLLNRFYWFYKIKKELNIDI